VKHLLGEVEQLVAVQPELEVIARIGQQRRLISISGATNAHVNNSRTYGPNNTRAKWQPSVCAVVCQGFIVTGTQMQHTVYACVARQAGGHSPRDRRPRTASRSRTGSRWCCSPRSRPGRDRSLLTGTPAKRKATQYASMNRVLHMGATCTVVQIATPYFHNRVKLLAPAAVKRQDSRR
jgi:hypothetical protein